MSNKQKLIGIIGAMEVEVSEIVDKMSERKVETVGLCKFYSGAISETRCVVAIGGVGKVNAAACTQAMIIKYCPDFIINIGIAGSLSEEIKIHDIVIASSVVQYDVDKSAIGYPLGLISGINVVNIPCSEILNDAVIKSAKDINESRVFTGVVATGDKFVASDVLRRDIANTFNAVACEMEGGSVGQVCYMNNVPFSIVRKISDNADEKSLTSYEDFEKMACKKMCDLVFCLVKKFS